MRPCFWCLPSFCVLLLVPTPSSPQILRDLLWRVRDSLKTLTDDSSELAYQIIAKKQRTQPIVPNDIPFPCDLTEARSPNRPRNVNEVRPGDIDVIGAIGDSLTAANGAAATNLFQMSREHRGISWSIGGQGTWHKYLTLPNILKEFNPNLIGFNVASRDVQFMATESDTGIKDLPYLSKLLVEKITDDPRVDVPNDWKLVTIMIGSNDLCSNFCFLGEYTFRTSPEILRKYFTLALDYLRDNLPRTIVNLVPPLVLESYSVFEITASYCRTMLSLECPCVFGQMRVHSKEENFRMQETWLAVQEEIARDERYRRADFLVVAQTFAEQFTIPIIEKNGKLVPDATWLTEDCFHLSQKGHASAANALWNNMVEPIGQKSREWYPPFERFICPTPEYPFIFSYENSPNHTVDLNELRLE